MHWFGGSIAEAVTITKQKNAIFVVFVEGDNDLSTEMAATIDDNAVISRLSNQANFLAIKLKSGSPNYTHFAQIYQFVPVPSLFFIGRNGTPLEVVCAGVEPGNLANRIDRILGEHHKDSPIPASSSSQNIRDQTTSFIQSEATPAASAASAPKPEPSKPEEAKNTTQNEESPTPPKVSKLDEQASKSPDQEYEVVCEGDVCVRRPKVKADEPGPSQVEPEPASTPMDESQPPAIDGAGSIEDKMEKAKELIEARRREKAEKEKEEEKEKERERRSTGQGVAELKRWQADQEMKQIQEERRREKMENNLARQRILEQIAQDRAERKARDVPQPATPTTPQAPSQPSPSSGDVSGRARIQFKLPDGSSHTAHFDADDQLAHVTAYVATNLQLPSSTFSLWTAFPRRELTEGSSRLRELSLAPSAALLVLPRRASPPPPAGHNSFSSVITFFTQLFTSLILTPTQQIYTWLRLRLFPPPAIPRASSPPPTIPTPSPPSVRRRGNVHRLPTESGPDDDNNTWNGNSTQQM